MGSGIVFRRHEKDTVRRAGRAFREIFVFMIWFSLVVLADGDFVSLRTHFWPFAEVVRKIRREGYASCLSGVA